MELGFGPFTGQVPPTADTDYDSLYDDMLRLADDAEAAGFDSVWLSEHHFAADGYLPSPMAMAAAIAGRTSTVDVGTAVALAPLYKPARLAEDAAVVDLLAAGAGDGDRGFTLGLGLGYRDVENQGLRVADDSHVGRLLDVVDTCRAAWAGDPLGPGREVDYPPVTVEPTPASTPEIIVGGVADPAVRRAARVSDGYLAPPSITTDELADRLSVVADELAEHDRDPADYPVYLMRYGFPHEEGEAAAWDAMKGPYRYLRRTYMEWFETGGDPAADLSDDEVAAMAAEHNDTWRDWAICGDATDWLAELAALDDAWEGPLTPIVHLQYPGMGYEEPASAVEYFGEHIVPELPE